MSTTTNNTPAAPLSKALLARISKESKQLIQHPPQGIAFWNASADDSSLTKWNASIVGPVDSPYSEGNFTLHITLPDRYPFIPPIVRFTTPIYHPNIDESGRICLDLLNMPPKGSWNPSVNLLGILTSLQALLQQPNPDDPLLQHIAQQYKTNQQLFMQQAREWTQKYATQAKHTESSAAEPTATDKPIDKPLQPAAVASSQPAGAASPPEAQPLDGKENRTDFGGNMNISLPVLQPLAAKRKRDDADAEQSVKR